MGLGGFVLVNGIAVVVVSGFNVVSFVSRTVGSFGSWKFLSNSLSFKGGREARECSRKRGLVEFCAVMFGKRVVVDSTSLAEEEEAMGRRWLNDKRELLRSSV